MMTVRPRRRHVEAHLLAAVAIGAALTGCQPAMPASDQVSSDLSGTYRLRSVPAQQWNDRTPNPWIDLSSVSPDSPVQIVQQGNTLSASYVDTTGTSRSVAIRVSGEDPAWSWHQGGLVWQRTVPIEGPAILPGSATHYRLTRYEKNHRGELVVRESFVQRRRTLLVFPFTDRYEVEWVLGP
jgi:hypothetical protein